MPGTRQCGKAALWRIAPPPGRDADQPPMFGWCTPHAAKVLRERMRQQCPERAPLAAARAAAVQVVADPDTGTDDPRDWAALRKANTGPEQPRPHPQVPHLNRQKAALSFVLR